MNIWRHFVSLCFSLIWLFLWHIYEDEDEDEVVIRIKLPLTISRWRLTDSFIPIERRKRDTVAFDSFTRWVANQEQIHRTSVLLLCVSSYYVVVRWLIDWFDSRKNWGLWANCRVNKFSFWTHVWGGGSRRNTVFMPTEVVLTFWLLYFSI